MRLADCPAVRLYILHGAGPRSAVGNVSDYRYTTCLTANPGITSSIPARSHTFVEIDHEIISTAILIALPLIQEELLSVTSESASYWLNTKEKMCG